MSVWMLFSEQGNALYAVEACPTCGQQSCRGNYVVDWNEGKGKAVEVCSFCRQPLKGK